VVVDEYRNVIYVHRNMYNSLNKQIGTYGDGCLNDYIELIGGNMSNIHYFQRYSQKENMVTNNTLLLFSRLYNESPKKFEMFINNLLENDAIEELNTMVQFKQQEKSGTGTIPDGVIEQDSFKIVIETKLYSQQNLAQIVGHLDKLKDEDKGILLWINKHSIDQLYKKQIIDRINNFKENEGGNITFASITFKEIIDKFKDILREYDIEMINLIEDYCSFCEESGLIDNSENRMRVVLTGQTFEQNIKYNVYYAPTSRGYQDTKYIGLYKNKVVKAVGEIDTIYDAKYDSKKNNVDILNVVKGDMNDEIVEKTKLLYLESYSNYGYSLDDHRRFFLVKEYCLCEYRKSTPGGIQGTRYFDFNNIEGYTSNMSCGEIADLLDNKSWGI
jgi:hypothetical protein